MSGNISNRGEIWAASWRLIQDHHWFEYKELKLPWLCPVVGYGPDLFQYAFLLKSSPMASSLLPMEVPRSLGDDGDIIEQLAKAKPSDVKALSTTDTGQLCHRRSRAKSQPHTQEAFPTQAAKEVRTMPAGPGDLVP